jgi:hypothetical protein
MGRWVRFPRTAVPVGKIKGKEGCHMPRPDDERPEAEEPELCEHGYPEGRGCKECEFWERVDYEYDRYMDK